MYESEKNKSVDYRRLVRRENADLYAGRKKICFASQWLGISMLADRRHIEKLQWLEWLNVFAVIADKSYCPADQMSTSRVFGNNNR